LTEKLQLLGNVQGLHSSRWRWSMHEKFRWR